MRPRLASVPGNYFRSYLPEKKRGLWPRHIIDIVPGSEYCGEVSLEVCLTSCSHDIAPKACFEKTFHRVYACANQDSQSAPVNPQEIALVFIIMAQGTMYNIEIPSHDPSAEHWLQLSERALVKGNFLSTNMVAGLQTLVSLDAEAVLLSH